MKVSRIIPIVLIFVFTCSCSSNRLRGLASTESATEPLVQINYYSNKAKTDKFEVFYPPTVEPGKMKLFNRNSKIEIQLNDIDSDQVRISLGVSESPNSEISPF